MAVGHEFSQLTSSLSTRESSTNHYHHQAQNDTILVSLVPKTSLGISPFELQRFNFRVISR